MAHCVSPTEECPYVFKYIIVGESGVGKTCLMKQFNDFQFDPNHEITIGVGCGDRILQLEGYPITKIRTWDTAGTEHFRSMALSYFRDAIGAILVYDITRLNTFDRLTEWLSDAYNHCSPDCVFMLVGNKRDHSDARKVDRNRGVLFSKMNNNIIFMETSAKTAYNVEEAFGALTMEIHDRIQDGRINMRKHKEGIRPSLQIARPRKRDKCCKN